MTTTYAYTEADDIVLLLLADQFQPFDPPGVPAGERVALYAAAMLARVSFPPITARWLRGGKWRLCDGGHRVAAARAAGFSHVPAVVRS